MYPESLYLLAYPVCSVTLLWSLWQNKEVCILVYGVALIIFSLTKTVCRFHPAIRGDEHERCEYLWYHPREMTTDRARNNSFLMACYSTGNVTVTSTDGSFVGGVVGRNSQGTVTGCYHATGSITSSGGDRIGGIAGYNERGLPATGKTISTAAPVPIAARMTLIRWTALTLPGRRQLPP